MAGLVHPTLAVAAVVAATAASVYLFVGRRFARRPAPPEARFALRMFALWWIATGVNILLGSVSIAFAAFGQTNLEVQVAYTVVQRGLLAGALIGLTHYLLVMVRGKAPTRFLVAFYVAYFLFLLGSLYSNDPTGVYVGEWRTDLEYAQPASERNWADLANFAWLVLPPVGLSIAAIVASRSLPPSQRPQRNRITLVGTAIVVWWVVAVLAGHREAFGQEFFQVFNRLLGLSMALVVLAAYSPPRWMQGFIPTPVDAPLEEPGRV